MLEIFRTGDLPNFAQIIRFVSCSIVTTEQTKYSMYLEINPYRGKYLVIIEMDGDKLLLRGVSWFSAKLMTAGMNLICRFSFSKLATFYTLFNTMFLSLNDV